MASLTLVHPEENRAVPVVQSINKCSLFQKNVTLAEAPYRVQSSVPRLIFRDFVSALEGKAVAITDTNFTGLQRLCEEFGFDELSAKLSKFFQRSDNSLERQIASPFTRVRNAHSSESFVFVVNGAVIESDSAEAAALFPAVREQLSVDGCARKYFVNESGIEATDIRSLQLLLSGETISVRRSQGLMSGLLGNVNFERLFLDCSRTKIRMNLSDLVFEKRFDLESSDVSVLSIEALDSLLLSESVSVESEDSLLQFILNLDPRYWDLLRHIQIGLLSEDGLSLLEEHFAIPLESVWRCAAERIALSPPPLLDSRIISDFPDIFAEFRGKRFTILWRGTRDGFGASQFHRRCDGQGNTLTVILDTDGNIFGGFTPVEWESRVWNGKSGNDNNLPKTDDSQTSFLFSLRNPHNFQARRFALKDEKMHMAIYCNCKWGPHFYDIRVSDKGNANTNSNTSLGNSYTNNTGLDGGIVFTGSHYFQVKEIEVFEIAD